MQRELSGTTERCKIIAIVYAGVEQLLDECEFDGATDTHLLQAIRRHSWSLPNVARTPPNTSTLILVVDERVITRYFAEVAG